MHHSLASAAPRPHWRIYALVALSAAARVLAYYVIKPLADGLAYTVVGLPHGLRLGEAVASFLYEVPKILLLLSGMIFVISISALTNALETA